jgi:potassium efflux system protein
MALALITNVLGVMRLSLQITTGTLNTIGIGLLLYLTFSFTKLGILFLVEFPLIRQMNIIVHHKQKVRKKMVYYTGLVFLIWFVVSITNQFDVARNIADAWNEFVNQSWEFGTVKVSIGDFLTFFTILFFTILISNVLRYLLGKEILVRLNLKRGIPNAISITLYYFILVVGLFLAASSTGIEWDKINLAVGALGVGIGFGLQNVVYNFISGLILIYERPVQVGDTIEIGSLMGNVTKIGVRASRVRTYGGAEVVVPNGNLISNEVINWTLSDQAKRQELIIKTAYSAKPDEVLEILRAVVQLNPKVISQPSPLILFEGYGDGTMNFRLLFWTHVDVGLSAKSEVAVKIFNTLSEKGFEMPTVHSTVLLSDKSKAQDSGA